MLPLSALSYGEGAAQARRNFTVTFLGPAFSGVLFGVLVGQTGYYLLHSFRQDRTIIRSLVFSLLFANGLHTALQFHQVYCFFVIGHQAAYDITVALVPRSAYAFELAAVHIFYIHRVWLIGRNKTWIAILSILAFFTFAQGLLFFVWLLRSPGSYSLMQSVLRIQRAISASFVVTDVALTASLLFLLLKSRKGSARPNRLLRRLISYTIRTGVLTSICALCGLVSIIKFPHTVMSACFWYLGSSLYATSLMASLNARAGLRAACGDSEFEFVDCGSGSGSATMPRFTTVYLDSGGSATSMSMSLTFATPPPSEMGHAQVQGEEMAEKAQAADAEIMEVPVLSEKSGADLRASGHSCGM